LTFPDSSDVFSSEAVSFSPVPVIRTDGAAHISNASAAEARIAPFSKVRDVSAADAVQIEDESSSGGRSLVFGNDVNYRASLNRDRSIKAALILKNIISK
jgi:hypothetical protein